VGVRPGDSRCVSVPQAERRSLPGRGAPGTDSGSVGIALLPRGGLRLVAASDAKRFLDACAKRPAKLWAIKAFRLEGDGVVLAQEAFRRFLTPDFRPAELSVHERIAIAREFCAEQASSAIWFDLLLSDPSTHRGEDQCPGGHLAPLPAPEPRLRTVEPAEYSVLRQSLDARRGTYGDVYLAEIASAGLEVDPRRLLRDLAVLAFADDLPWYIRIEPVERVWQSLPRESAIAFATKAVAHELAYKDRLMEDEEARSIVERFVALFGPQVAFYTNQDIGKSGLPSGGFPVTTATMEATLGATDGRRVGFLIITGED
jgi:hypothetical protein